MGKIDSTTKLQNPNFIKPMLINYTYKGMKRTWEAVLSHDSVSILIWHEQKKSFIIVKQLRATVLNKNKNNGYTYELCAGIIDKQLTNKEIAKEEILEECGFDVPLKNLQKIGSYFTSVGISGAKQTLYFTRVDDSIKVNDGGGLEEEDIEVIYVDISKAREFMFDESYQKTPGLIMAFYWFFDKYKE